MPPTPSLDIERIRQSEPASARHRARQIEPAALPRAGETRSGEPASDAKF
ncbi:hypothetical protein FRUB_05690 [Fimbriiglobus ruber]|uniref:Uncharacterized protein n=1 Tax=Fimbriiglobus ruber TaxID=1908690 RepID=A0A225DE23_9BACT|nr:hypothetical protein FRUB_05690 [Fimbriiglobus ruber]